MRMLVTGGSGFIGSNFIRIMLRERTDRTIVNLDKLTYAGNPENLRDIEKDPRYRFVQGDICDASLVGRLAGEADVIVNFAAETHVDRSIQDPGGFVRTNIEGTYVLLEAARRCGHRRFLQISTDEVYGSIDTGAFTEDSPLHPNSPYSAAKAAADLMVLSYFRTFGLPVLITRCTNNYGPFQYPEKLIPLFITNAMEDKPLPLYGDGMNVRDWIFVADHCEGVDLVLEKGQPGEIYNLGGGCERTNREITAFILKELGKPDALIKPVADRPGHDRRYALDFSRAARLGFKPRHTFEEAMRETLAWYGSRADWWSKIKSGEFRRYYDRQYAGGGPGAS